METINTNVFPVKKEIIIKKRPSKVVAKLTHVFTKGPSQAECVCAVSSLSYEH